MSKRYSSRLVCGFVMTSVTLSVAAVVGPALGMPGYILPAYSQSTPELKKLNPQFVTESGCPIEVVGATTAFEVDSFGTPLAARHYIDYRNSGNRAVAAVKFRIAYVSEDGKIHQPYLNAPDGHALDPGGQASQKWRGDKVDPKTAAVKIRVLLVKYSDGSIWESEKINQTNAQQQEGFVPLQTESPGSDLAENFSPGQPVPFKNYATPQAGTFPVQTQTGPVQFKSSGSGTPGFEAGAFGTPTNLNPVPGAAAASTYAPAGAAASATTSGGVAPAQAAPAIPATAVTPPAPADPMSQLDAIFGNPKTTPAAAAPPAPAASPALLPMLSPAAAAAPPPTMTPAADPILAPALAPTPAATALPELAPTAEPTPSAAVSPPAVPVPSLQPLTVAPAAPDSPLASPGGTTSGSTPPAPVPVPTTNNGASEPNQADKGTAALDEFLK